MTMGACRIGCQAYPGASVRLATLAESWTRTDPPRAHLGRVCSLPCVGTLLGIQSVLSQCRRISKWHGNGTTEIRHSRDGGKRALTLERATGIEPA